MTSLPTRNSPRVFALLALASLALAAIWMVPQPWGGLQGVSSVRLYLDKAESGDAYLRSVIQNTRWHRIRMYPYPTSPINLLIKEVQQAEWSDGVEGQNSVIVMTAWNISEDAETVALDDQPRWHIRVLADQLTMGYTDATAKRYGCCAADDTLTTIDLLGGQVLFVSSQAPVDIGLDGYRAALLSPDAVSDEKGFLLPDGTHDLHVKAVLTYASPRETLQKVAVIATDEMPEMLEGRLMYTLAYADNRLTVGLESEGKVDLVIPVADGRLDIANAVLPPGITLQEVPL